MPITLARATRDCRARVTCTAAVSAALELYEPPALPTASGARWALPPPATAGCSSTRAGGCCTCPGGPGRTSPAPVVLEGAPFRAPH